MKLYIFKQLFQNYSSQTFQYFSMEEYIHLYFKVQFDNSFQIMIMFNSALMGKKI